MDKGESDIAKSILCLKTMNKAERKVLASPKQDTEQILLGVNPETSNTNANTKEINETKDKSCTQTKRKRSPDTEPSEKKRKHDVGQNVYINILRVLFTVICVINNYVLFKYIL